MAYAHELTDDEKRELLRIARASLRELAASGKPPPGAPHRASLVAPAQVAVRARVADAELAGRGEGPLFRAIQDALGAALAQAGRTFETTALRTAHLAIEITGASGPIVFDDGSHPPAPPMIFPRP